MSICLDCFGAGLPAWLVRLYVRGFEEEGTTTTPFDMVVLNELDRFHLAIEVIERVSGLGSSHQTAIS
jgi:phosphoketolase